jgi:hypothetical protein
MAAPDRKLEAEKRTIIYLFSSIWLNNLKSVKCRK